MADNKRSPSPDTSSSSDTEDPDWYFPASPSPVGPRAETPGDAASGPLAGENSCAGFSEDTCGTTGSSPACMFYEKLWEVTESHCFKSIWWGNNGNCVVLAEKLFQKEVLKRKGPLKIFETESVGGFILELNLHGFSTLEDDCPVPITIQELQAVAAAGPSLGKLLFFSNPFFRRDNPDLPRMCLEGCGERERALAASLQSPVLEDGPPRERRDDALAANNPQHRAAPEPWDDPDGPSTSAGPPPAEQCCSHSLAGIQGAAMAPCMASPQHRTPPAPNSPSTSSVWPRRHPLGWPTVGAGWLPDGALDFGMDIPEPPHAAPQPPHGQPQNPRHCPTCSCPPYSLAANGDGAHGGRRQKKEGSE